MIYASLFVTSFLAATVLPFGSEAVFVGMLVGGCDAMAAFVAATLGNWLGSMTTYALGYAGDWRRISKWLKISPEKTEKVMGKTEKYGAWFGLLVWVPGVGDVICVCLGLLRTPIAATTLMILLGKAARYAFLAVSTLYFVE